MIGREGEGRDVLCGGFLQFPWFAACSTGRGLCEFTRSRGGWLGCGGGGGHGVVCAEMGWFRRFKVVVMVVSTEMAAGW